MYVKFKLTLLKIMLNTKISNNEYLIYVYIEILSNTFIIDTMSKRLK